MPVWDYDLIIIGGGPAGLTSGIDAGRARLHALRLEKPGPGAPLTDAEVALPHPGFPEGISGFELSKPLGRPRPLHRLANGPMAALAVARYHAEQK